MRENMVKKIRSNSSYGMMTNKDYIVPKTTTKLRKNIFINTRIIAHSNSEVETKRAPEGALVHSEIIAGICQFLKD
jgi:hypothetical protein